MRLWEIFQTENDDYILLQKKAIRLVSQSSYNAHTDPLFAELNVLKFPDLHEYACTKLALKIIDKSAPIGVRECFNVVEPSEMLRSRMTTSLEVPTCKTDTTMRMVSYTVPKIFFTLPCFLKEQTPFYLKDAFFSIKMDKYGSFECNNTKCYSCTLSN